MQACHSATVIVGPTASGKTELAHRLADRWGLPVLSADSMMVYRGMDRGTAKPAEEEREQYSYMGLDYADPSERFNTGRYLECVKEELGTRGGDIIAVGGTGLYLKALHQGLDDLPEGNPSLRAEYGALLEDKGLEWLAGKLRQDDPELAERTDLNNPRRVIRALETTGLPRTRNHQPDDIPFLGIHLDKSELNQRIQQRAKGMFRSGLIDETRQLLETFGALSPTAAAAIGYREAIGVLDNTLTVDEAIEKTIIRTRQYAKRQMTWFRNQAKVHWLEATGKESDALAEQAAAWVEKHGRSLLSF